ncbi:glucose-1-phosphate adenylyltransferase [Paenibacillus physcomitrellae]|uniref:Glucose-1-phosphate adenylyltransferase n=1 Tax=Paenibacillus physcomitrellae TaxID=1619311 RepID=A0ABQ1FQG2_9BACL|nr:glucose-1-phosphate adenylyltransferase [Paenibacillus physcomitrellae]GGA25219.1 glucose-1-phosphate adenylyltransferase [Paenibacillus physcomitrellae]
MSNKQCIAMLLAGGEGRRLSPLTSSQAKPAVPFGSRYRIIDFPLSNCVNSGIDTIGVLTQYEADSLHNHIGDGTAWGLGTKENGGIALLPSYQTGSDEYLGTADAIYKNMEYIDRQNPENVLVLSGDHIYHMDYRQMLEAHLKSGAPATISVMPVPWEEAHRFGVMVTDDQYRITEFAEKPEKPQSNLASMGIYLFKWSYLKQHLIEDASDDKSSHDFGKDVIPKMLAGEATLQAYPFKGYWRDVGTVGSLWEAHMDLLCEESDWKLHKEAWPMYTNESASDLKTSKHSGIPAKSSMIHDNCALEGYAERSVVFGGTAIGRFTKVKDSVVMPNVQIGRNVLVECAIIGEGAMIKDGAIIKGTPDQVVVIGPGETVLAKPAVRSQSSRLLKEVYDNTALRAGGMSS